MPPAHFLGLCPGLVLAQHPDDLLLAEATPFHRPSPFQATDSTSFRLSFRGAGQNLVLHARLFDIPEEAGRKRVADLLALFQLESVADNLTESLPLGIRQRLSLAVAVIHEPEMLI